MDIYDYRYLRSHKMPSYCHSGVVCLPMCHACIYIHSFNSDMCEMRGDLCSGRQKIIIFFVPFLCGFCGKFTSYGKLLFSIVHNF